MSKDPPSGCSAGPVGDDSKFALSDDASDNYCLTVEWFEKELKQKYLQKMSQFMNFSLGCI